MDERLDGDWLRGWCERTAAAVAGLTESFEVRHGFPPGDNVIAPATDESHRATGALVALTPIPADLATVYRVIDEVSLPDVANGCFVHPASLVAEHVRAYGPVAIPDEGPATVFASDGGGRLFAVTGSGRVWMSTAASWSDRFDLAAAGLREFFEGISRQVTDQL
ncbi:hypothetical protein ACGFX4_07365 [Kitasatospora sp. NPDC048365]|uniref:hypothetical protein n=1 Tax=Kitasatospora sp. NPDC048365 TaxID=3364050 RepID=UPI00371BD850